MAFDNPDPGALERSAYAIVIEPAVVVAGHADGWRTKARELRRDGLRNHEPSADHTLNHQIHGDADQSGCPCVGPVDCGGELVHAVQGRSDMQIGKDGDAQRTPRRPGTVNRSSMNVSPAGSSQHAHAPRPMAAHATSTSPHR